MQHLIIDLDRLTSLSPPHSKSEELLELPSLSALSALEIQNRYRSPVGKEEVEELLQQVATLSSLRRLTLTFASIRPSLTSFLNHDTLPILPLRHLTLSGLDLHPYPQLLSAAYHISLYCCTLGELQPSSVLGKLTVYNVSGRDYLLPSLPHCPTLRFLNLDTNIRRQELAFLPRSLTTLILQHDCTEALNDALPSFTALTTLELRGHSLTLKELPFLRSRCWKRLYCQIYYRPGEDEETPLGRECAQETHSQRTKTQKRRERRKRFWRKGQRPFWERLVPYLDCELAGCCVEGRVTWEGSLGFKDRFFIALLVEQPPSLYRLALAAVPWEREEKRANFLQRIDTLPLEIKKDLLRYHYYHPYFDTPFPRREEELRGFQGQTGSVGSCGGRVITRGVLRLAGGKEKQQS